MKKSLFLLQLVCWWISSFAQKQALDSSVFSDWPVISNEKISNNGRFVIYDLKSNGNQSTLCIIDSGAHKTKNFKACYNAVITEDSHRVIFQLPGDTMCIYLPDSDSLIFFKDVLFFKTPEGGNGQWL
ncbi:MAG TPA: hypothetical protein VKR58_14105, partial [Aquella sp.]|nr:hypothetical protein [Aquella sp.]